MAGDPTIIMDCQAAHSSEERAAQAPADDADDEGDSSPLFLVRAIRNVDSRMKLLKAALKLTQLHKQQIVHGELVARGLQRIRSNNEAQLRAAMREPPRDPEAVRWKSPKSLKGAADTFAIDVFTFGMCILEAVSGQVPWGGKCPMGSSACWWASVVCRNNRRANQSV